MKRFLPYFIIFALISALFFWLQSAPTFGDGDPFYHAKMAEMMLQNKWPTIKFPWLPFTTLQDNYADHHLLFHLLIIPFILVIKDPLIAIKVATIILAAVFFVLFYWLLKKWKIKYASFYTFLLLIGQSLPFRLALSKAPAASLIMFILIIAALLGRKKILLFLFSFIYVWMHGGWPIAMVATLCYCLADALEQALKSSALINQKIENKNLKINYKIIGLRALYVRSIIQNFFSRKNLKLIFVCLLGLSLGVIINPYFPQNLYFYWEQIFKVAIVNYQAKISVGAEWTPYEPLSLLKDNFLICLLWLFAISWSIANYYNKPRNQETLPSGLESKDSYIREKIFLLVLSATLFLYTIKARRMAEYLAPVAILFIAFVFNQTLKYINWRHYWQSNKNFLLNKNFLFINAFLLLSLVVAVITLFGFTIRGYIQTKKYFTEARPLSNFKGASDFVKNHISAKKIIFHNCWTYFPMLFYYNDQNYYITGLDSTFFYDQNKKLYYLWWNIISGQDKDHLAEKIKNNFQANYIITDKPKDKESFKNTFIKFLNSDSRFQKIYEDQESQIFQIIN